MGGAVTIDDQHASRRAGPGDHFASAALPVGVSAEQPAIAARAALTSRAGSSTARGYAGFAGGGSALNGGCGRESGRHGCLLPVWSATPRRGAQGVVRPACRSRAGGRQAAWIGAGRRWAATPRTPRGSRKSRSGQPCGDETWRERAHRRCAGGCAGAPGMAEWRSLAGGWAGSARSLAAASCAEASADAGGAQGEER